MQYWEAVVEILICSKRFVNKDAPRRAMDFATFFLTLRRCRQSRITVTNKKISKQLKGIRFGYTNPKMFNLLSIPSNETNLQEMICMIM